jgi:hypothetical protein
MNFVMITSPDAPDQSNNLRQVYSELFAPYVLRNPFYIPKRNIQCKVFEERLKSFCLGLK